MQTQMRMQQMQQLRHPQSSCVLQPFQPLPSQLHHARCCRRARRQSLRVAAAKDEPPPSKEDRANPNKADFSAYWSLKFREFFSKRRQYLELARKRQEPPEIFQKIDEQIRVQEDKLEAARIAARWEHVRWLHEDVCRSKQGWVQAAIP
jgi:hypothetical protein